MAHPSLCKTSAHPQTLIHVRTRTLTHASTHEVSQQPFLPSSHCKNKRYMLPVMCQSQISKCDTFASDSDASEQFLPLLQAQPVLPFELPGQGTVPEKYRSSTVCILIVSSANKSPSSAASPCQKTYAIAIAVTATAATAQLQLVALAAANSTLLLKCACQQADAGHVSQSTDADIVAAHCQRARACN